MVIIYNNEDDEWLHLDCCDFDAVEGKCSG